MKVRTLLLHPVLIPALLFCVSAIFSTSATAQGQKCSVMSATKTGDDVNTNAGSCGMYCEIISETQTYHVSCSIGLNPPFYTNDPSATATGQAGLTGTCNPTFSASIYHSTSTSIANQFTLIGNRFTVLLGTCNGNGSVSVDT
jgi:hypothetical protein